MNETEKTITIVSTRTWKIDNTLFNKDAIDKVDDENINKELDSFFKLKPINWATILDDSDLEKLWRKYITIVDHRITIKHLLSEESTRNLALSFNGVKEFLYKNEKYKKEIDKRDEKYRLYHVKKTDVYGIKALDASRAATEWIPKLLNIAKLLCPNTEVVNVNLFLHDKDITNENYYEIVKEATLTEMLPKGKTIDSYGIKKCTIIFFQHKVNPIMKLINSQAGEAINEDINSTIDDVRSVYEMMLDSNKLTPSN